MKLSNDGDEYHDRQASKKSIKKMRKTSRGDKSSNSPGSPKNAKKRMNSNDMILVELERDVKEMHIRE